MSYVWTNERPTVPGHWWYREQTDGDPVLVFVRPNLDIVDKFPTKKIEGKAYRTEFSWHATDVTWNMNGQWAGPIEEPKETTS